MESENSAPVHCIENKLESNSVTKGANVLLVTPTNTFPAQINILAAHSSVFASICFQTESTQEGELLKIELNDWDDHVLAGMLEFISTGKTGKMADFSTELLGLAHKFKLLELKTECEHFIASHLMIENAADILHLAVLNDARTLKSAVVRYIKRNRKRVSETESYKKLSETQPQILLELYLSNYI